MKEGWKIKQLGDVCKVIAGQSPQGKYYNSDGNGLPFYQGKKLFGEKYLGEPNIWTSVTTKESFAGDIVMSVRAPVGNVNFNNYSKICIGRGLAGIRAGELVNKDYLFYFLINYKNEIVGNTGAVFNSINKSQIETIPIPIPPLDEQKRIVAKLDKIFEAIDKAKANVEKNLQNAKELFQSKLNEIFSQKGDGWAEKKLGNCIKLKSGDGLTAKKMNQDGEYPVYGGNGIAGMHDKFNLDGSNVIIGRVGALCGNVRNVNQKIWLTDNAFKVSEYFEKFDNSFLTYLLNYKNLREYARQAAQPVISNSSTKDILLQFPKDIETQGRIVNQLDELKEQIQPLESKYLQELGALDELKKSILQKAFEGEL